MSTMTYRKILIYVLVASVVFAVTVTMLGYYGNVLHVSPFLSVIMFSIYLSLLAFSNLRLFGLLFYFAWGYWGALLGGAFIENGAYVSEQLRYGYHTGGSFRLFVYGLVFLFTVQLVYGWLCKVVPHKPSTFDRTHYLAGIIINVLLLIIILILLGWMVRNGTVFDYGRDRFYYANYITPEWFQKITNWLYHLLFLSGLALAIRRKSVSVVRTSIFGFLGTLVILILQGNKFSGLLMATYLFLLPSVVLFAGKFTIRRGLFRFAKGVCLLLTLCVISFCLINYHYSHFYGAGADPIEALMRRVPLQGHVWWGVDEYIARGTNMMGELDITRAIHSGFQVNHDISREVGLGLLMTLVSPSILLENYFENGVRFTCGYPAIGLYYFGYFGLVLCQIVLGMLLSLFLWYWMRAIRAGHILRCFICVRLFLLLGSVLVMGDLYMLFSYKLLIYVVVLLATEAMELLFGNKYKHLPKWI